MADTTAHNTISKSKLGKALAEKGFISASEAAKRLGVSVYTVYRKIEQKKMKGALVNGHWFIEEASLAKAVGKQSDALGQKLLASLDSK